MAAIGRRLCSSTSFINCLHQYHFQFRLCKTYNQYNINNPPDINSSKKVVSVASDFTLTNPFGLNTRWGQSLHFKLCKTAQEHPEILFLKVNKPMCKNSNVKDVLPYFHFYRGADGQLVSFSCSRSKRRRRTPIEVD
ncbi:hypothetical protein SSX86_021514 [Deinandra increscens subsp. villosa]|uniref:Uncharacterized protein n=1 Tax=Deinandra increscens subsp. villosa TaxID=3103831 RepID=A0AAP0GRS5_9ASTR